MNDPWPHFIFINYVIPMRGYHLPMSQAINSTIVNDTTYCTSRTPNIPAFSSLSI
ncbi:Phosphoglycerate kinase [Gossypium arboreum]|uniref:Phosphoglycerate kinase n=1 Tax=Gossypium arboreum TaxID=29729 RepID=A0A0B0N9Q5_GOSAR|nr:Phosphoglycerate kinase [Gossypium arboreum]